MRVVGSRDQAPLPDPYLEDRWTPSPSCSCLGHKPLWTIYLTPEGERQEQTQSHVYGAPVEPQRELKSLPKEDRGARSDP